MMIKKVEIFWWGSNVEKNMDFFFLRFKPLFCQSTPTNITKVAAQVHLGVLQHPHQFSSENIDRKILFLKKIKISTRWLSQFFGLF